jgi:hypothetical protein
MGRLQAIRSLHAGMVEPLDAGPVCVDLRRWQEYNKKWRAIARSASRPS